MDLTALFSPKSVAIVGASAAPEKVGGIVLKNVITSGFKGPIYPVNPGASEINGLKCYPAVKSLPEIPDLAIVAIPTLPALDVLAQIGEAGIKNVVVYTAGFKEVGEEGAKLEKQLLETAQKYNLNVLGPNCFGFVNNLSPINTTFGETYGEVGNLRFISQSGAIASSLFDWCKSQGLGFSDFVTLGNKTVINENDVLRYFQKNALPPLQLKNHAWSLPIGLYLESIVNGAEFLKVASELTKTTPVFILKPGKTSAAATAMKSHTGSIAGEDSILEAALKQSGVIRCQTLEDFFDLSRAFAWENPPLGARIAIIYNAGGPAVICADAAAAEGLELVQFDEETRKKLLEVLPRQASIQNPIDLLGDALADRFAKASEIILQTSNVDALVVILTPQVMTQIDQTAEAIGKLSEKYQKPIFCSFIGGTLVAEGEQKLNRYKIPSFRFPERAIMAIGAMWRFKKRQLTSPATVGEIKVAELPGSVTSQIKTTIKEAGSAGHKTLDNLEADKVLRLAGIPTPDTKAVETVDEALFVAEEIGWPVVLKLSSAGLLHKRKIGGVITEIRNPDQLRAAWDSLERKILSLDQEIKSNVGIQLQKEVASGVEIIVGVKRDPTFGLTLLFGAGGSLAELIADRNLQLLPINLPEAQKLIQNSKAYSLLKGNDNEPALALDKLYDLLIRLGHLAEMLPEVTDIEINPVIVTLNDVWAVDGKVILESKPVAAPKFKVATTVSRKVLAGKYHYFEFCTEEPFMFKAGQYISVKVASTRINCYSIAGANDTTHFNLLVDTTPGGPGSKFFESLQVGGKITFLGPLGTFTLSEKDGAKKLIFVGTGSGLAPLKCQLETILKADPKSFVSLYLGLNSDTDVFFVDYFEELKRTYQNFNYKVVVYKPGPSWQGCTGFVTEYISQDFPKAGDCAAYLCGNKFMIADVTKMLTEHGCKAERIYTEKYA